MNTTKALFWITALALTGAAAAQTRISLRDQGKEIDFSAAATTRPVKTGTSFPAQCALGEMYFKTDAIAGQNLFACTASGTWSPLWVPALPSTTGNNNTVLSVVNGTPQWSLPGGDISGPPGSTTVQRIQNRQVSSAAPSTGMALVWNAATDRWEPQFVSGGGSGTVTVQGNGTTIGSRNVLNWLPGFGFLYVLSDNGSAISIQHNIDTAVVQTHSSAQSGASLYCNSSGGSATNYTCSLLPGLTTYSTGMVLNWRSDVSSAGGPVTLNVNTLGARPVKLPDGVSNPGAGDIVAGRLYPIWYDGANLRLAAAVSTGGGGGSGSITLQADGSTIGSRSTVDLVTGTGVTHTVSDTGSKLTVQTSVDTALIPTKPVVQSGMMLFIADNGSTDDYIASANPALTAYTTGMVLFFRPNTTNVGTATLNVDSLGAKTIRTSSGATLANGDLTAGRLYGLWYDGVDFRRLW